MLNLCSIQSLICTTILRLRGKISPRKLRILRRSHMTLQVRQRLKIKFSQNCSKMSKTSFVLIVVSIFFSTLIFLHTFIGWSNPTHVSINNGVFLCSNCAIGIHLEHYPVEVSCIKSISDPDQFNYQQLRVLINGGNQNAFEFFEIYDLHNEPV